MDNRHDDGGDRPTVISQVDSGLPALVLEDFDSLETNNLEILLNGQPTGWFWTFAGPAHPMGRAQSERLEREAMRQAAEIETAQANGRTYRPEEKEAGEMRASNINFVLERLISWNPVTINGERYDFTYERARALLEDRKKNQILAQALKFVTAEKAFMRRSGKLSSLTPSADSH